MTNSYLHMVAMTYIYQKETNVTDWLEFSILSYLHYSLHIVDDANVVITQHICYNLNLLKSNSTNSLDLSVRTGVSADITNMQKKYL